MSSSTAGSPGIRVTSKRQRGSASPLPSAFAKASFRVQQAKNACSRRSLQSEWSVATSRGEKHRSAILQTQIGSYALDVYADVSATGESEEYQTVRVGRAKVPKSSERRGFPCAL